MKDKNKISINIWDDYYNDDYVPDGENQSTYAYIEGGDLSSNDEKKILEFLLELIKIDGVKTHLEFYDSKKEYANFLENSYYFQRWEIIFENITHKQREQLVEDLRKLNINYNGTPLNIYSES